MTNQAAVILLFLVTFFFFGLSVFLTALYIIERNKHYRSCLLSSMITAGYEARISALDNDALANMRLRWFASQPGTHESELGVEVKFIHPLLGYLGYGENDYRLRVPVSVQVGRNVANGIADWVVYSAGGKPRFVIEAKEPSQALNSEVAGQARSYAYALGAPMYVTTNGKQIKVYSRRIDSDELLLAAHVDEIEKNWTKIVELLGK